MDTRFDITTLAPQAYQGLYAVSDILAGSSLGAGFKHLIDLRVSQLNNCHFCQNLHREWGLRDGVTEEQLAAVAQWPVSPLFDEGQRAAFAWAEALTRQDEDKVPGLLAELRRHHADTFIAELTMTIAVINAWNRVGISAYAVGPHG
ncbi:4-carboxymuconolactone decarboxylase domain/alkylhydroperoxidase AhpD family core domain protein [Paramagnetospirillum magnetotacticum MS-1]|uniref:4-carboxymuconolactone decarboxylase domain/alkylhydroperoxidase AhpD family core domain protein n=1 Tax=Paramagnetospirillum magnetotacticum MS-1 TaxID=272627 RepID=A0A0C2UGK8_PARME|nr:carboxymuconolactone decarboxylase family protein [Paramagnetospirillum magnetotacticum]KIM00688.1 4-carboxymuconolactone decarboxylase domain/alkylhydroperoxidase AhpD family core domain protein [Paramagnetospirillum magnetotacticum MS-1]